MAGYWFFYRGYNDLVEWQSTDFLGYLGNLIEKGGESAEKAEAWLRERDRYGWMPPLWDVNPFPKMHLWR